MAVKRKGEQPPREAAQDEEARRKAPRGAEPGADRRPAEPDADPREEEGWNQPESSAQKHGQGRETFPEREELPD